ncbi:MAG TPA: NADPH-dependent FMN reductase [Stellaceae bacterium]|nr:NADPH-dependent FMN reductase [Stellaceae bacterium]
MSDSARVSVLGICGSLRRGSYNMAALRAAIALRPADLSVTIADIAQIPPYNEDVRQAGFPPVVETLRRQIAAADAILFACPEYNYSMTGVLKNAIDWASRPPDQPFAGKPCAIIGAAAGMAGSARAQYDLRRACVFLDMHPLNKPEVLIGQAQTKFDADGNLLDEAAKGFIRDLMANLAEWTRLIGTK